MFSKLHQTGFAQSVTCRTRGQQPICFTMVEAGSLNRSMLTAPLFFERMSSIILKKTRIKENSVSRVTAKQTIFGVQFSIETYILFSMTVCSLCQIFEQSKLYKIGGVEK